MLNNNNNNKNKFPVTTSMYLYSNGSWATTNHTARSIHIIVQGSMVNSTQKIDIIAIQWRTIIFEISSYKVIQ